MFIQKAPFQRTSTGILRWFVTVNWGVPYYAKQQPPFSVVIITEYRTTHGESRRTEQSANSALNGSSYSRMSFNTTAINDGTSTLCSMNTNGDDVTLHRNWMTENIAMVKRMRIEIHEAAPKPLAYLCQAVMNIYICLQYCIT